jgi:hypothetical protein
MPCEGVVGEVAGKLGRVVGRGQAHRIARNVMAFRVVLSRSPRSSNAIGRRLAAKKRVQIHEHSLAHGDA